MPTLISGPKRGAIASQIIDSFRRYAWKRIPYESSLLYTLVITDKCTLRCEHCFEEAGPENNTFLDAYRVDELAGESIDVFKGYLEPKLIRITGGDPFLHPELYNIIEAFSKRKDSLNYDSVEVETNGWWATSDRATEGYVRMLKEAGVDILSMTVDYYHCKQGKFDIYEHSDRIETVSKEQELPFRNINVGMLFSDDEEIKAEEEKHAECCQANIWGLPEVTPIGRARSLPEKYWGEHAFCTAENCRLAPPTLAKVVGYIHMDEITIGVNGNVYPCNSGKQFEHVSLSLGNIYENPMPGILEHQNNPVVQLIRDKGLSGLSKLAGIPLSEHWKMYYKFSPCGLCHEILREHGDTIAERLNIEK